MGDSGSNDDTSSTAEDFNSLEVTDPGPPSGGDDNNQGTTFGVSLGPGQGSVSATGSTTQDAAIGFTDGQGGAGPNFEAFGGITNNQGDPVGKVSQSPSEFASALNATQGGDSAPAVSTPAVSVPSIQAAITTPTIAGQSASIFDPDLETMTGRRDTAPRGLETGVMAPEQRGTPSFDAFGDPVTVQSFLPADVKKSELGPAKGISAVAQALGKAQERARDKAAAAGIDFGVTTPIGITAGVSPAPPGFEEQVGRDPNIPDGINYMMLGAPGTSGKDFDVDEAMEIAERNAAIKGPRTTDQILADQRRMQQGQIPLTTATGAEDPFDPNVGAPFDVRKLEQMEAIMAQPNVLPGVLGLVEDKTKDALATSIALGRNVTPLEAAFGYTAPDMTKDKETIEEFNARTGRSIPQDQIVTDTQGVVIGLKDAMGNLVTGRDPSAQDIDAGGESEPKKKVPPKKPTDPCPEGYQLIDGKCTPTGAVTTDTGFVVFPPSRDPAFQRGPFTPATVATNPGIRGLNPITFNIPQNIFRR